MDRKIKIINVVGARPNFMKIAPLIKQMRKNDAYLDQMLVHTGQHYDKTMSGDFFEQLGIPEADINLGVGSESQAVQTAKIMIGFEKVILEHQPDIIVVVGDVNSTVACALVASKMEVRIAHVEAGLRSFDRTMPEEINRVLTDAISDFLFITEPSAFVNLQREGIENDKIFFVGNVMIDTLIDSLKIVEGRELPFVSLRDNEYGVVTIHRPSNVDQADSLEKILDAISILVNKVPLVLPLHPRTMRNIDKFKLKNKIEIIKDNGIVTGPLSYFEMLKLTKSAKFMITDSGGLQEETTYLGIPCITLRKNTERPITVTVGTNVLVGDDTDALLTYCDQILCGRFKKGGIPEFWDGKTAERIVNKLLSL